MNANTLVLVGIVRSERGRSSLDERFKINRTIAEYRGHDGEVYRKSFESKRTPHVPQAGTHDTLADQKYQWADDAE